MLYDRHVQMRPSPVVRLNRAIALRYVIGPVTALEEVDGPAADLDRYHLFHATRGELLRPWIGSKKPVRRCPRACADAEPRRARPPRAAPRGTLVVRVGVMRPGLTRRTDRRISH